MKIRFTSLAALAAILILPLAANAADDRPDRGKGKGGAFVSADTDGDKKLSEPEFVGFFGKRMGEDRAKKAFGAADANGDRYLDRAEFRAHMQKMRGSRGGKEGKGGKKKSGTDT